MGLTVCPHDWRFGGRAYGESLPDCDQPNLVICMMCAEVRTVKCGKTSSRACSHCGAAHRGRVGVVAGSGLRVGRDGLFITLTAPTWLEHYRPDGQACRCTGGGCADLAEWNATAGKRFNRFMQELRRAFATDLQYFKGAEVQRRGALHYHVLIRGPRPLALSRSALRRLAIRHGFGHSVDVQGLEPAHAGYVSKYVSKASDDRTDVPWRGYARTERLDPVTGELVKGRRVAYAATYRTWSASARWGDSMAYVRAAQAHYVMVLERLIPWNEATPWPGDADVCPRRPPEPGAAGPAH